MPPRYPRRDFNPGETKFVNARDDRRADESLERRDRARQAVVDNGGRSAPQSAASRPTGLTPLGTPDAEGNYEAGTWRSLFPNAPTGYANGRAPRISARDSAIAASGPEYLPGTGKLNIPRNLTGPLGNATTDAANLAQNMQIASNPRALVTARGPVAPAHTPVAPTTAPSQFIAPTLSTPVVSSEGITRMSPEAQASARALLPKEVFQAGTPQNIAFVAHAKQFGEQSAHDNLDKIMAPLTRLDDLTKAVAGRTQGRVNAYDE